MNSFNDAYVDIKAKTDAIKKLQEITANCTRFKIGKTGQNLVDRFDSEYKDQYDRMEEIYSSPNKSEIDDLEKFLIEYYQSLEKYSNICDNEALGGGDMNTSVIYYIYVVIKD